MRHSHGRRKLPSPAIRRARCASFFFTRLRNKDQAEASKQPGRCGIGTPVTEYWGQTGPFPVIPFGYSRGKALEVFAPVLNPFSQSGKRLSIPQNYTIAANFLIAVQI